MFEFTRYIVHTLILLGLVTIVLYKSQDVRTALSNYNHNQLNQHNHVYNSNTIDTTVKQYVENIVHIHEVIDMNECLSYTPCNNCSSTSALSDSIQHHIYNINFNSTKYFLDAAPRVRAYGFGATTVNRVSVMFLAIRSNRALLTYPYTDVWSYDHCTKQHGVNGCAVRQWSNYTTHNITEYENILQQSKQQLNQLKKQLSRHSNPPQQLLDYAHNLTYLSVQALGLTHALPSYIPDVTSNRNYDDILQPNLQYGIEQSGNHQLQPYKHLPPFWWTSQTARYMLQPVQHIAVDMIQHIVQSLQLPEQIAIDAIDVYDMSDNEHTRWQLATEYILYQWRISVLQQSTGTDQSYNTTLTPPSFMYVFIRTGDKITEVPVHNSTDYAHLIESVYQSTGIKYVYIGSDNSHSVHELKQLLSDRYIVYTSTLLHEFDVQTAKLRAAATAAGTQYHDPFESGFVKHSAQRISDLDKYNLQRRVFLEYYISALADTHIGTYSSNHCRIAYIYATAMQNRYTLPMISLDIGDHRGIALNLINDKIQRRPQCKQ